MASVGKVPRPLLCPLGKGRFCSIRLGSFSSPSHGEANISKEVQVISTDFQIENIEAILAACQSQGAKAKNLRVAVLVKERSYTCNSKIRPRVLDSDMPMVAALSMDTENIDSTPLRGKRWRQEETKLPLSSKGL